MKSFKMTLGVKANLISLVLIAGLICILWLTLPNIFKDTSNHDFRIHNRSYRVQVSVGGIGGQVSIRIYDRNLVNRLFRIDREIYHTADLSPIYIGQCHDTIRIYRSDYPDNIETNANLPVVFQDISDTIQCDNLKIAHPYLANWK